jgi:diamine N-acetyltransferase
MTPTIALAPVTRENYRAVCKIPTEPGDEKFVASNPFSLAQAAYEPGFEPDAIMAGGEMVGFVMCDRDAKTGDQWICRLMIAAGKRRQGFGRAAMEAVLARYRAQGIDGIYVSFVPENRLAQSLYIALGFADTGKVEDGEYVYYCKVH